MCRWTKRRWIIWNPATGKRSRVISGLAASRAAVCLDNLIPVDFNGTVQCDGYSAYRAFANTRSGAIELAGCWAHVRRKFHEALEQSPKTAGWVMRQIQHLY